MSDYSLSELHPIADEIAVAAPEMCGRCPTVYLQSTRLAEGVLDQTITLEQAQAQIAEEIGSYCTLGLLARRSDGGPSCGANKTCAGVPPRRYRDNIL